MSAQVLPNGLKVLGIVGPWNAKRTRRRVMLLDGHSEEVSESQLEHMVACNDNLIGACLWRVS